MIKELKPFWNNIWSHKKNIKKGRGIENIKEIEIMNHKCTKILH